MDGAILERLTACVKVNDVPYFIRAHPSATSPESGEPPSDWLCDNQVGKLFHEFLLARQAS
jgi:hypothetical protein